jgi:hypothetical protein
MPMEQAANFLPSPVRFRVITQRKIPGRAVFR